MQAARAFATSAVRKSMAATTGPKVAACLLGRPRAIIPCGSTITRLTSSSTSSTAGGASSKSDAGSEGAEDQLSGSGGEELLRGLNPDEVLRVGVRTQEMWKDHLALTTSFPEASLPPKGGREAVSPDAVRRKRLVYRSKQRGWLEVDLLMGTWAEQNVPFLTVEEMDSYEDILNLETVDIFSFIAGNADPPAFVDTAMMKRLQAYVKSNPLGQTPESYASAKRLNNLT